MKEVFQGDILHVEGVQGDIIVASTNRFNQTGMVIGCPVIRDGEPGALHIEVNGKDVHGVVACEQIKALDLSSRGFGKVDEVSIADIMEVSDAIQGIFDYVYQGMRCGELVRARKVAGLVYMQNSGEEIIETIVKYTGDDPIVSTTGKASRELFEIRERMAGGVGVAAGGASGSGEVRAADGGADSTDDVHGRDFLTVGSMGHASSIALGIALQKPDKRIWCIDGDGALQMHMGAMAVISDIKLKNLIHIVINNGAHETVGGQPTVLNGRDLAKVAADLGYEKCYSAEDIDGLNRMLTEISGVSVKIGDVVADGTDESAGSVGPIFLEVKCAIGARVDLGRPTTSAKENKEAFMRGLSFRAK